MTGGIPPLVVELVGLASREKTLNFWCSLVVSGEFWQDVCDPAKY